MGRASSITRILTGQKEKSNCLNPFCVVTTKYWILGNVEEEHVCLSYESGDLKVQTAWLPAFLWALLVVSELLVEKWNGNWPSAKGSLCVQARPAAAPPPPSCLPPLTTYCHGNKFPSTIFSLVSQESINELRGWSPQVLNTLHLVSPLKSSTAPHCSHASFPHMKLGWRETMSLVLYIEMSIPNKAKISIIWILVVNPW